MNSTAQMFNWFWWKHRIQMLLMIGSVIIAQSLFWGMSGDKEASTFFVGLSLILVITTAITVFTFGTELNLTSGKSSFPKWLFTLPVSTTRFALVTATAMMLAMAWGWFPFAYAVGGEAVRNGLMTNTELLSYVMLPWLAFSAAGNWMQAVAWWPYRSALHRLFVVIVWAVIAALLFSIGVVYGGDYPWLPVQALIFAAVSGFAAAVFSASQARYLTWRAEQESSGVGIGSRGVRPNQLNQASLNQASLNQANLNQVSANAGSDRADEEISSANIVTDLSQLSGKVFGTASSALRWRDWNQLGRVPVILMLIVAIPMALLNWFFATDPPGEMSSVAACIGVLMILIVPSMICTMSSPSLGKTKYWKEKFQLSPYLSSLPVSDYRFLLARYANSIKVSVAMWAVAWIAVGCWLTHLSNRQNLFACAASLSVDPGNSSTGWLAIAAIVLFTLYVVIVLPLPGMALGLCGHKTLEKSVMIAVPSLGVITLISVAQYVRDLLAELNTPQLRAEYMVSFVAWLPNLFVYLLLAKLLMAAGFIWLASTRKVLSAGQIVKWGVILTATLVGLIGVFCFLLREQDIEPIRIAMVITVLFPFGSIFFARFGLDWNRHR